MVKCTLIISVYEKVKELELIFYALTVQTFHDFEVIVAEDGTSPSIKKMIETWKSKDLFKITHLSQENRGFRKNKILNEAIRNSSTNYLIFTDGDCIPHPKFIKAHYMNRKNNTVLCGRRVNYGKNISQRITKESIVSLDYKKINLFEVIYSSLNRHVDNFNFNIEEAFIFKNDILRKLFTNEDEHIMGCNFSIHKNLLIRINGFDENYEGPGIGEDSDIEFRLRLTGVAFASVRNLAVQFHIYHEKTFEEPANRDYFSDVKKRKVFFCQNGLVK